MAFKINNEDKFWQDAYDNAEKELNEVKEIALKRQKKKKRKTALFISLAAVLFVVLSVLFVIFLLPQLKYNKALSYIKEENYEKAIEIFTDLGDYKDSVDRISRTKYDVALRLYSEENYGEAYIIFDQLSDYRDSMGLKKECLYKDALKLMEKGDFEKAKENLTTLGNYKEAGQSVKECSYQIGLKQIENKKWEEASATFSALVGYKDSEEKLKLADYNKAQEYHKSGKYAEAVRIFEELADYEDSKNLKNASMFAYVKAHQTAEDTVTFEYLKELLEIDYEDSKAIYKNLYAWQTACIINNNKEDKTTDSAVISRFDTVYFHVTLSGGAPNATTTVKYEIIFPGGSIQKGDFGKDWKNGSEGCTWVWFKTPAYAETGYAYIKLFDKENNQIGEDSVYIAK